MHELSGGGGGVIGMRNIWHGDCHVSSWIKKGVLHLDQKEFGGGKDNKKGERKERKKEKEVQFSTSIPAFEQQEFDGLRSEMDCAKEVGVLSYFALSLSM